MSEIKTDAKAQAPTKTETQTPAPTTSPAPDATRKSASKVYVYANLPHGQSFGLSGKTVTLAGYPISHLLGPDGAFAPGGKYGVTEVDAEDWEEIKRLFGRMKIFASGLVFAAPSREAGDRMAAERGQLRHGLEPVDPDKTETQPAKPPKADKGVW